MSPVDLNEGIHRKPMIKVPHTTHIFFTLNLSVHIMLRPHFQNEAPAYEDDSEYEDDDEEEEE
jgi:hypothetical protein